MAQIKTKPTAQSVERFLGKVDAAKRQDVWRWPRS
jgi:hypothetical protein